MEENEADFIHSMPPRDNLHLNKYQGQFISLDTFNAAKTLGEGIVKVIDNTPKEKYQLPLIVNSEVMDALYEPCQHLERNATENGIG